MGKIRVKKERRKNIHCSAGTIYKRTIRKTGKTFSTLLHNKCEKHNENQERSSREFGILNKAVSQWIKENKDTEPYQRLMTKFKRQEQYKLFRNFIAFKGFAKIQPDGSVVLTIDSYSTTIVLKQ